MAVDIINVSDEYNGGNQYRGTIHLHVDKSIENN